MLKIKEGEPWIMWPNILGQKFIKIIYPIKIQHAIELVSNLYQDLLLEIINMSLSFRQSVNFHFKRGHIPTLAKP